MKLNGLIRKFDPNKVTVVDDRTYAGEEDQKILAEISQLESINLERAEKPCEQRSGNISLGKAAE